MLKEEEYFNFIRRAASQHDQHMQASLNRLESEQQQHLIQKSQQLIEIQNQLYEKENDAQASDNKAQQDELVSLRMQQVIIAANFQKALAEVRTAFQKNPIMDQADVVQGLALQGLLQQDTALIHFLPLGDNLRIILRTQQGSQARQVNVTQTQLNKTISQYKRLLQQTNESNERERLASAQQLYQWLIHPLAGELQKQKISTLLLYKNGALRYIPLATLYDGKQYLIESYALGNYTAAAQPTVQTGKKSEWVIAGLGVSRAHEGFTALSMVPQELDSIVKQSSQDPNGIFNGDTYLDDAFTSMQFKISLSGKYNVNHIATHYRFMPGTENDSFLLLGDGSRLSLAQIRRDKYDFHAIDLLTLSACDTAVSSTSSDGREVEGLATLVQRQGARGVMATLWPVADCSTGLFMQRFYQYRQNGQSKAGALRQTQLDFLQGRVSPNSPLQCGAGKHKSPNAYKHPYYWAPFILMGNWQ